MPKFMFRFVFALTILSAFLFTGSTLLFAENVQATKTGRVNTASVNVRTGPDITYSKIGTVKKDMKMEILEQKNGWYKVKLWKITGWVRGDLINTKAKIPLGSSDNGGSDNGSGNKGNEPGGNGDNTGGSVTDPVDSISGKHLIITGNTVNVRSGAGTGYNVVAKVNSPEKFEVVQQQGDWYKIVLPDGKEGWVAGWLTQIVNSPLPSRGDTGSGRPENPDDGTGNIPGQDPNNDNNNVVTKLTNIDYDSTEPGNEKIVITGSGPIQYTINSLKDPHRLVIDIKNCDINSLSDMEVTGGIVNKIRLSQYSVIPMAVRIVLDLNINADFVPLLSQDGTSLRIMLSEPSISGKVIVIDPGHGGWDNGATGVTGLKEKIVNLDTALKLKEKLTALGATVIMTREDDTFISLTERSRIANDANADVFVSMHANANVNPAIRGTSTYFFAGNNLSAQYNQRERLARLVQNNMVALLGIRDIGILQENFAVLRGTNMPSILVESAFLSNASDEQLLKEDSFRDKVAQGVANGLKDYFSGVK